MDPYNQYLVVLYTQVLPGIAAAMTTTLSTSTMSGFFLLDTVLSQSLKCNKVEMAKALADFGLLSCRAGHCLILIRCRSEWRCPSEKPCSAAELSRLQVVHPPPPPPLPQTPNLHPISLSYTRRQTCMLQSEGMALLLCLPPEAQPWM